MKKILVACDHSQIDVSLRRSLAHLVKSCEIDVVHDGYNAFGELNGQAFNLIIVDSSLPGIDSLELIESIQYIDPDVPVILMLKQTHKAMWNTARHLKAHPIIRPFKALKFLRLVDKLLHQHLSYYRELDGTISHIFVPLKLNLDSSFFKTTSPEDEEDEIAINWEFISNTSDLLGRLDDLCRLN